MKVLFITWDGPQVNYLESLFLPIFKRLSLAGISFHVLQFTWGSVKRTAQVQHACEEAGVSYQRVTIWRRFGALGPMLSALAGAWHVNKSIRSNEINVLMPRSTLPALAAMLAVRHFSSVGLLFDADGLPHDERVDFGEWSSNGLAYRLLRDLEASAIRRADAVLTRSKKAVDILVARGGAGVDPGKFHVVCNGRDANLFKPALAGLRIDVRRSLGIENTAPLLVFVGSSINGKYSGREMLEFFRLVLKRREDAQLLFLLGSPEEFHLMMNEYEDLRSCSHVLRLPAEDVPRYLGACDLGLAFIQPSFSMQAAAAIKLGEYLLCGIPALATRGIGDTEEIVTNKVGYVLNTISVENLEAAAEWFVHTVLPAADGFRESCRDVGVQNFSLEASVNVYARALKATKPD